MKVHALLVAINNYNRIPKLRGCTNDIEKIERYLTQNEAPYKIEKFLNDKATKSSIVDAFTRIKQQLTADDSFLFYYAGHGTQEMADPMWEETDGRLECIVCYDDHPLKDADYLLSDKELRYLIFELSKTGCHIATIFDCCHSGDNTRNAFITSAFDNYEVKERRYKYTFPQRRWEDFIFHNCISYENIAGKNINEFLPQGTHVQIAACESNESAMEVNGEGVFTKALVKVLTDTGGKISYYDLRSRIRQYLRFVYEQQPRIYTVASKEDEIQRLLFTRFLNNQYIDEQKFITEAVYNKAKGWLLNFGAIHGINKNTVIDLIDPMIHGKYYRAAVKEIFVDYALIEPGDGIDISPEYTVLKAKIEGLELYELSLHIKRYDGNPEKLKAIADALVNGAAGHYVLTENENSADYSLHVREGHIYITLPGDQFRPLVRPIEFNDVVPTSPAGNSLEPGIKQVVTFLKHISAWSYIKSLQNKEAYDFSDEPIKISIIQVFQDGAEAMLPVNKSSHSTGRVELQPAVKSALRIRLTNNTEEKLFLGVIYLNYNFQVYIHLLERKVEVLHPREFVYLGIRSNNGTRNNLVNLQLPDIIKEYNWPGYQETIKIIISTEEFNPEALSLGPLPGPYTIRDQAREIESKVRSFYVGAETPVNLPGWLTQTVHLKYPNIFFNKVDPSSINEMLEWDKTTFFAKGLYEQSQQDHGT